MELEVNKAPIPYEDNERLVGFRLTDNNGQTIELGDMEWTEVGGRTSPTTPEMRLKEVLRHTERDVLLTLDIDLFFGDVNVTIEVARSEYEGGDADYDNWQFERRSEFEEWATEHAVIADSSS